MHSYTKPIAVLGGGNGAHAMVAYLSSVGLTVKWWMIEDDEAQNLTKQQEITSCGALDGTFPLTTVSSNLKEVVQDTKLIMVVIPANAHGSVADALCELLHGDETVILHPGRTAGALSFLRDLQKRRPSLSISVGETDTLLFTSRKICPGLVDIMKIKEFVRLAFLGNRVEHETINLLQTIFPQMKIEDSTLMTGLSNIGAMLHPAPVILNIGRIENKNSPFKHYYDGITPTIAAFIEKMDEERIAIGKALDVTVVSTMEWHNLCYGIKGKNLYETIRLNERYASLYAPETINHRYIYEDIPTGLTPLSALAKILGIAVPCIDTTIEIAQLLFDTNFKDVARTAERMGLSPDDSANDIKNKFRQQL